MIYFADHYNGLWAVKLVDEEPMGDKLMIIKKITIILSLLFVFSNSVLANDYYVYVCAESEDEVALIKFDGKKAVVEKTIPVGVCL